jgi:3',5'-nucleoside bisphosphate phosphatase
MDTGGADLHLHSQRSDGILSPARLVELAAARGLETLSLTDHDTLEGVEEALDAGVRLGVRVLTGVELSAEFRGREVHLLAYGFDAGDPSLRAELGRLREGRRQRAQKIVRRLNDLNVPLTLEAVLRHAGGETLGRPHVAQALAQGGFVSSLQAAFDRYLNPGAPAYVPWARMAVARAREVVHQARGVLVLAHPYLNLAPAHVRALVDEGLDGLETVHPGLLPAQRRELTQLAAEKGILGTGGSDFHGEENSGRRLGAIRMSRETVEAVDAAVRRLGERPAGRERVSELEG